MFLLSNQTMILFMVFYFILSVNDNMTYVLLECNVSANKLSSVFGVFFVESLNNERQEIYNKN
jgi:hypothetical protein